MEICTINAGHQLYEDCRSILQELAPGGWKLVACPLGAVLPKADIYVWDLTAGAFSQPLNFEVAKRSLFVLEPELLQQFRERLGTLRASILLKPGRPAALRPFLEHAVREHTPRTAPTPVLRGKGRSELEDFIGRLLPTPLKEYDRRGTFSVPETAFALGAEAPAISVETQALSA